MALFLVANEMSAQEIMTSEKSLAYPASVLDLIGGRMGQPPGGFPEPVIKKILGDQAPLTSRPGESLPDADIEAAKAEAAEMIDEPGDDQLAVTRLLSPKVFADFAAEQAAYGDVAKLPTPNFFYGQHHGEEIAVDIEKGKRLIIKYLTVGQPHPDGSRTVFFELNGQPREVSVLDKSLEPDTKAAVKADPLDDNQVAASMPGMVITVAVAEGEKVKEGQKLGIY